MLTELACKNAIPKEKAFKLSDAGGLYLFISTAGSKTWRWKYRFGGKEKLLSIGRYPAISLKEARLQRDAARVMLASGIDPAAEKQETKKAAQYRRENSFEAIARQWHKLKETSWLPRYAKFVLARMEANVFPHIGKIAIDQVTAPQMLDVIRKIEARGAMDLAHRIANHASDIFVFAISSGVATQDPAATIRRALAPTDPRLRPALVKMEELRQLLRDTEARPLVHWSTLLASRLLALTAVRPSMVRLAEFLEFEDLDGKNPIWRIPAHKMKLTKTKKRDAGYDFIVPLSAQAVDVVKATRLASPSPIHLFTGVGSWLRPISDSTLSKLYREAGYTGRHVPHGWRAAFSTIMNELASVEEREQDRKIIDLMLAHAQAGVEPIYNRAAYMPRRRELAQSWADMLMDGCSPPEALLPSADKLPIREAAHERLPDRAARRQPQSAKGPPQR